jgi:hypothetical protein
MLILAVSVMRKAMKSFNLFDGTFIPEGEILGFDIRNAVLNKSTLENPNEFDGFRYVVEEAGLLEKETDSVPVSSASALKMERSKCSRHVSQSQNVIFMMALLTVASSRFKQRMTTWFTATATKLVPVASSQRMK